MDDDTDRLLDEQLEYYGRRAPIYDQAYTRTGINDRGPEANERWWSEIALLEAALDTAALVGDVLELGCGTGHWTQRLAATARSVTALDGAAPMLDEARRLVPAANVTFELVDLVRSWQPAPASYDAVAAFFFLEHVPDTHFDSLVARVAVALRPGGAVFVAEGLRREDHVDPVEHRELPYEHDHDHDHDHDQGFRVVERRRGEAEFADAFGRHGIDVSFTTTPRNFCVVQGVLRPPG